MAILFTRIKVRKVVQGKNDMKIIELKGSPFEIGFKHGEMGREEVHRSLETLKRYLKVMQI